MPCLDWGLINYIHFPFFFPSVLTCTSCWILERERQRDRETERERQTDRETDRQRQRQRQRERRGWSKRWETKGDSDKEKTNRKKERVGRDECRWERLKTRGFILCSCAWLWKYVYIWIETIQVNFTYLVVRLTIWNKNTNLTNPPLHIKLLFYQVGLTKTASQVDVHILTKCYSIRFNILTFTIYLP